MPNLKLKHRLIQLTTLLFQCDEDAKACIGAQVLGCVGEGLRWRAVRVCEVDTH